MRDEQTPEMQQSPEEQEIFQTAVPESKRTALLRYMVIMFAVAFVLVLMTMVMAVKSSHSTMSEMNKSALEKTRDLQDANRLQAELLEQKEQELTAVQQQLSQSKADGKALAEQLVEVTAQRDQAEMEIESLNTAKENQAEASEALARVLIGPRTEGDVEYARAVETLRTMKEHLDPAVVALYEEWLKLETTAS